MDASPPALVTLVCRKEAEQKIYPLNSMFGCVSINAVLGERTDFMSELIMTWCMNLFFYPQSGGAAMGICGDE